MVRLGTAQLGVSLAFFVKVIPPSRRARIHEGVCYHCRYGQGQRGQQKSGGPTFWTPAYPESGISLAEAELYIAGLEFADAERCKVCVKRGAFEIRGLAS